jgi:hypothetical protein
MMKTWSSAFVLLPVLLVLAMAGRLAAAPEDDVCPVHKVQMKRVELRLVYGLPSPGEFEEMKVAGAKFPHGRDYVLAGCVVQPAKSVAGFLCPKCVEARAKWCRAHGKE